jgi:hypothetical protein
VSNPSLAARHRWVATLLVVATTLLLAALTCAAGNAVTVHQRLNRGPIIWHAGRLAVSAEITTAPHCAPLAQTCWVQHPARRPRYFSTWVYLSTPRTVPWRLSKWHVIVFRVGRETH